MLTSNSSRPALVRTAPILLASLLLSLVLAACGGGPSAVLSAPAAKVGDASLTQDQLEAWIPAYETIVATQGQTVAGEEPGTWSAPTLSGLVAAWVRAELVLQAGEARDLEPSDDEIAAAQESVFAGADTSEYPDDFVELFSRANAMQSLLLDAVVEEEGLADVGEEALQALYDQQKASLAQVCVSQIVVLYADEATVSDPSFVATEAQIDAAEARALDIIERIDGGADFAEVATNESDDPVTAAEGGDAGCFAASEIQNQDLAARLDELEPGDLDPEPYPFSTGFLIFQLTDRTVPTLEEMRDDLVAQVEDAARSQAQASATELLAREAERIGVEVNAKYGTWDAETVTLSPPAGPQLPSTTVPADLGLVDPTAVQGG